MKVLVCHNTYKFRGGEDHVFEDECWLLEQNGCDVVTYQRNNSEIDKLGSARIAAKTVWNTEVYHDLRALIRETQPDVAHFHNTFPLISPAAYYAVRHEHVPVVQTLHNYRIVCPGSLMLRDGNHCQLCLDKRLAWPAVRHRCYKDSLAATAVTTAMSAVHHTLGTWLRQVSLFITPSEYSKRVFAAGRLPPDRIRVKPNFVRPDPGMGAGDGDYAIFVGRLSVEKGVGFLVDAWVRQQIPIPLWIIGEGPLETLLPTDHPKVRLLGQLPHDEVLRHIANAKLLVFPSIVHETFGRSMAEAFATGTPVVATDMEPMNQMIRDGDNGLLFERSNAESLAFQVRNLLANDALRQQLRAAGRREFELRFSPTVNFHKLMAIYDEAIQLTSTRPRTVELKTIGSSELPN